jgi:hypothetical protein
MTTNECAMHTFLPLREMLSFWIAATPQHLGNVCLRGSTYAYGMCCGPWAPWDLDSLSKLFHRCIAYIYIYIYLVDSAECPRQAVLSWQGVLNKLIKGLVVSSCHNPSRFKKFMRAQCLPPNAPVPRISNCTNRILPIEH